MGQPVWQLGVPGSYEQGEGHGDNCGLGGQDQCAYECGTTL